MSQRYPPSARVFLGNIDNAVVTKSLLRRIFSQYGDIKEEIRIHKGYAFVQYGNEREAEAAVRGENYKQLGSKRIEAEIAKGERRNGRSGSPGGSRRRRDRSADRGDNGDHKRQRTNDMSGFVPIVSQPMMGAGITGPAQGGVMPMGGPLGAGNMVAQGLVRPLNVPVYIMSGDMSNYASHVSHMLGNAGINAYVQHIDENMLLELIGQNRFGINSERFTIFLKKKNEMEQSVAFRAFQLDGSTPGFADTPIQDVIQYINMNRDAPQAIMQQGGTNPVPPSQLDLGGFKPQQPSQSFIPGVGFNLQNLQQELLKFQQPSFRNATAGQSLSGIPPPPPLPPASQVSNLQFRDNDTGYNPENPAPRRPSPPRPSRRQQKREQQQQKREKQRQQKAVAQQSLPASDPVVATPQQSTPSTQAAPPPSMDILSTITQLQSMISSGASGKDDTAILQNTLSSLLTTLQQQQQQPQPQQQSEQIAEQPETQEKTPSTSNDADSKSTEVNGDTTAKGVTESEVGVEPAEISSKMSEATSSPDATNDTSTTISSNSGGGGGGGDISNILASLQTMIGNSTSQSVSSPAPVPSADPAPNENE